MTARTRDALLSLAVAVAVAAGICATTELVHPGRWLVPVLTTLAVTALVVVATRWALEPLVARRARPGPWVALPTVVGAVVGLATWVATATQGDPTAPGTGALDRAVTAVGALHSFAQGAVAPVDASAPVTASAALATVVLYLAGDVLAVPLRTPAAGVAAGLVPWIPALVVVQRVPVWCLAVAVLVLALALALDAAPVRSGDDPEARGRAGGRPGAPVLGVVAASCVVALAAVGVGAAASAVQPAGSSSFFDAFRARSQPQGLGNDLDVLQDLGEQPTDPVLRVTASGDVANLGPLRLYTLVRFDGERWEPAGPSGYGRPVGAGEVLWPDRSAAPTEKRGSLDVEVDRLPPGQVALPTVPRSVSIDAPATYDPVRDELALRGRGGTPSYTVQLYGQDLRPDDLRGRTSTFEGSSVPDAERAAALAVPRTAHGDDVARLAREITATETDAYGRALAVQDYLRDTARFTYSTRAPEAVTGDAVWDFLQARSGFCVQYATAMTVMLRDLGIPTRVGVGYLTRDVADGRTSVLTGREAHAWPEVYFDGVGWVRFEPTPAVQTGAPPRWASSVEASAAATRAPDPADDVPEPTRTRQAEDESSQTETAGAVAEAPSTSRTTSVLPAFVVAGLVVLVLAGLGVLLARRRRGAAPGPGGAEEEWQRLRRRLAAAGVRWPDSTTPRQVPGVVAAALEESGAVLEEPALDALGSLALCVERARYAAPGAAAASVDPATLAGWVDVVVDAVHRAQAGTDRDRQTVGS